VARIEQARGALQEFFRAREVAVVEPQAFFERDDLPGA
jgi:hypothetical protein